MERPAAVQAHFNDALLVRIQSGQLRQRIVGCHDPAVRRALRHARGAAQAPAGTEA